MSDKESGYWEIDFRVLVFEDRDTAEKMHETLIDAFCEIESTDGLAIVSGVLPFRKTFHWPEKVE